MATKILKSIKGNVIRVTRLDECGNPVVGTCSTVVSECFVSVTLSGEYETGDEFVQKSAWGTLCISDKDPDQLKRVNVAISMAEVNPDIMDIITGSTPVVDSGNTVGSTWGSTVQDQAFALEVWTKSTGTVCSTTAPLWGYFLVPFIRNGKLDGDLTIENGALTAGVMGEAFPAPDDGTGDSTWDTSPYTPNPFLVAFPAGDIFGIITTDEQPPTDTAGCVAIAP
jgi:hypothetical protein